MGITQVMGLLACLVLAAGPRGKTSHPPNPRPTPKAAPKSGSKAAPKGSVKPAAKPARGAKRITRTVVKAAPAPVRAEVSYVHSEKVFLSLGSAAGLKVGTLVDVRRKNTVIAQLRVESVAAHHSVAQLVKSEQVPRPGDDVVLTSGTLVPPAVTVRELLPPEPVDPRTWQVVLTPGFSKVGFRGSLRPPPRRRAEAFLHSDSWLYMEQPGFSGTNRERLVVRVDSPLDPDERWHVRVDAQVVGQVFRPSDARLEKDLPVWMDVYEASLAWRGAQGLELGGGRSWTPGLRYGLVDGFFASWEFGPALTLRVALGERPDSVTLVPHWRRPAASTAADGVVGWGWGSLGYSAAVSWLAHDVVSTEAGEASGRATLELLRTLWLDADVAGSLWGAEQTQALRGTLEHVGVSATVRQREVSLRAGARRLGGSVLPSETRLLPPGYLANLPSYDVNTGADATAMVTRSATFSAGVSSGATWDDTHHMDRIYLVPELRARFASLGNLSARAAYRCELGYVGGQLVETGFTIDPFNRFRVGLWQQGGVWVLQPKNQLLPAYVGAATVEYRILRGFSAGLRTRSFMGGTGNGQEVHAWVGTNEGW